MICFKEIFDAEREILSIYNKIRVGGSVLLEDTLKRTFIHLAYRWRTAVSILKDLRTDFTLNANLIPVWLFGLSHLFWKANHFCWNLNQYGKNEIIKDELQFLFEQFSQYEWVQYQILSNIALVQELSSSDLGFYLSQVKMESSELVRFGFYKVLLNKVENNDDLLNEIFTLIKAERSLYIKETLLLERADLFHNAAKNWLGL